jgi:hypothetical protein
VRRRPNWHRQAPEYLRLEVLRVHLIRTVYPDFSHVAVTVDARVRAVERSATHLRPGQKIRIQYERNEYNSAMPGPRRVPILEVGKVYPAFLEKQADGPFFRPAAAGHSFHIVRLPAKKDT